MKTQKTRLRHGCRGYHCRGLRAMLLFVCCPNLWIKCTSRHLSLDSYTAMPGTTLLYQQTAHRSYNLRIGDHPLVKFSLHSSQEAPIHPGVKQGGAEAAPCIGRLVSQKADTPDDRIISAAGSTLSGMLDFQCSHGYGPTPLPRCVQVWAACGRALWPLLIADLQ